MRRHPLPTRRASGLTRAAPAWLALALLLPAQAGAAPAFTLSYSPGNVAPGLPVAVSHRLEIASGAQEERFAIRTMRPLTFSGEGETIAGPAGSVGGFFPCEGRWRRQHWSHITRTFTYFIRLPPNAHRVAQMPVTLTQPPWPFETLGSSFDVLATFRGATATLQTPFRVASDGPRYRGPVGTEILLSVAGNRHPVVGPNRPDVAVRAGRTARIRGRTNPARRGDRVDLRYFSPKSRRSRLLARVRVRSDGRFRYDRWHPRQLGSYEVYAVYRRSGPKAGDASECGVIVRVRR